MSDSTVDKPTRNKNKESSDGGCRPTFYMSTELLAAIDAQCAEEGGKKRSPFLSELMELLITSPIGEQLRANAAKNRRSLAHELEANLVLFNEHVPTDEIAELAEASQRNPDQMLVRLVLLGLRVYKNSIARMEVEIKGGNEPI
ncbi:MAG: hypothetical protein HC800_25650 [Phormidesmis sp. RL_2_1]|nr:hypothetical protein [Phormidesmis sp. RL_2_1]